MAAQLRANAVHPPAAFVERDVFISRKDPADARPQQMKS